MLAAVETGYDHVGLPPRLGTNTTVYTRKNKAFAAPTNESPVFFGQSQLGSHGDSSCNLHVSLRQFRIFMDVFFG